jgi:FAD:protein FMN transferase
MQRRDFLSVGPGQSLVPLLPQDLAALDDCSLLRASRRAMATTFEVAIPYGTPNALAAAEDALDLIDSLEEQLTVYRDTSEVSQLNATAHRQPVTVESGLFDLLQLATTLTNETAGAFDIAIGSLIKAWGFYRREGRVPTTPERTEALSNAGARHLVLDGATTSVKFRKPLEINLGSIGKGYALDRAAELLRTKWGIVSALLHGGGSSVYALGKPPHDSRGWAIAVRHPHRDDRTLGTVWLADRGFATSAATFQHFIYNGQKLGHVIDPRTGWPAKGTECASVVATSAAEADALSTAFFVSGLAEAELYLRSRPHLCAVILPEADELTVLGFTNDRYSPPTIREIFLNTFDYWD